MVEHRANNKYYKIMYYLITFIIGSFVFSFYSFIKVLRNPVFITDSEINELKQSNTAFIINGFIIPATVNYIIMIIMTLSEVFNYYTSRKLYNIFYCNYVVINIISLTTFLINFESFKFFQQYYNYYYISIIIQFAVFVKSIIFELIIYCGGSNSNQYENINQNQTDCKCVCCDECFEFCISCCTPLIGEERPLIQ
jgi:hypothetical protein